MVKKQFWVGFVLTGCMSIALGSPLFAVRIGFPVNQFHTEGIQASQVMTILNDSNEPFAAMIDAHRRTCGIDGEDILSDPVDDFVIDPQHILLPPGESIPVNISYIGPQKLSSETAYRIAIAQVKLGEEDFEKAEKATPKDTKIELNFLVRNLKAAYVSQSGMKSDTVIVSAEAIKTKDGKTGLEVVFHNRGTLHDVMQNVTLRVQPKTGDSDAVSLSGAIPYTNILAGHRRRFVIPWPETLPVMPVHVTYSAESGN